MHDSIANLRAYKVTEIPAYKPLYEMFKSKEMVLEIFSAFGLAMALGELDYDQETSLNVKHPDIKTTRLAAFVEKWWKRE